METIILFAIVSLWILAYEFSPTQSWIRWKEYRPTADVRVGMNAMKNFGRFILIFAVLYWIQIQFGDAEAWFDAFQRS